MEVGYNTRKTLKGAGQVGLVRAARVVEGESIQDGEPETESVMDDVVVSESKHSTKIYQSTSCEATPRFSRWTFIQEGKGLDD